MTRRPLRLALAVATIGAAALVAAPALAITGGSPDTVHTNVGLVRFTTTDGRFRCSGTLIAPTVVLTAGHCTEGPATNVYVSFDDGLSSIRWHRASRRRNGRPASALHHRYRPSGPSLGRNSSSPSSMTRGRGPTPRRPQSGPESHRLRYPSRLSRCQPGQLKNETFTLVGYGVDIGDKKEVVVVQVRSSTTSYLKNVGSEVVTFQINDRDSKAGGGSCFGDSGGAVFLGQYVLGDASYVNSLTCNALGSYQRADTAYSRAFLELWIDP
jgi:hypothetical protein